MGEEIRTVAGNKLLTVAELAELMGVSIQCIYKARDAGRLDGYIMRDGRGSKIRAAAVRDVFKNDQVVIVEEESTTSEPGSVNGSVDAGAPKTEQKTEKLNRHSTRENSTHSTNSAAAGARDDELISELRRQIEELRADKDRMSGWLDEKDRQIERLQASVDTAQRLQINAEQKLALLEERVSKEPENAPQSPTEAPMEGAGAEVQKEVTPEPVKEDPAPVKRSWWQRLTGGLRG